MPEDQAARAARFAEMHGADGILVLPNAWDAISACVLAEAGFEALATTSGGCAFSLGYGDGENIPMNEMAAAVGRIVRAVRVPVSADMEAGYGSSPEDVAGCVRATLAAGAVGINIEDSDKSGAAPLLDFALSVARIEAAVAAAREAGVPAVINARTDGFHFGSDGATFDEAVRRANAYLSAGAGCAFVPFVRDAETIGALTKAIDGPMNVLAGPGTPPVAELAALGVKRVTVGSNITKAALVAARKAAEELRDSGTYEFARGAYTQPEVHALLKKSREG
ncbi:MAG: isocitrate lyase/phosphoenolpyruvate mutase family protein [Alphaproteobacteria bacterium]|nr:isocitrate lyase/phosphoenolpyruvate mutase family protein [Alphaproteobacteria bacterium]